MDVIIGAGKYVFGEDIPMGKFDLTLAGGEGYLTIRYGETEEEEDYYDMGSKPDQTEEYRNLTLPKGRYFTIDGSLKLKIRRSKMLDI